MYHYSFYVKKLNSELNEKSQAFILENHGHFEVQKINSLYKLNYELAGEKEKCDESMAHLMEYIIQRQAILKTCHEFFNKKEGFTTGEQREIGEAFLSNNYLSRQEGFSYITYYLIYLPALNEIKASQGFNIEGWLAFRLRKYQLMLMEMMEQFVNDYLSKKEVVSFIRMMREVSFFAVPLEEELHIVYNKDGKIFLYNKEKKNVTGYYIKKYCKELILDSSLLREDLILHILITLCPKKIIVHHQEWMPDRHFVNALEIIFEENLSYCQGCDFCKNN